MNLRRPSVRPAPNGAVALHASLTHTRWSEVHGGALRHLCLFGASLSVTSNEFIRVLQPPLRFSVGKEMGPDMTWIFLCVSYYHDTIFLRSILTACKT